MKKSLAKLLVLVLVLSMLSSLALAADSVSSGVNITVNGTALESSETLGTPFIYQNRTLVPLRAIAYGLGMSEDDVVWNSAAKTATFTMNGISVTFTSGSNVCHVATAAGEMDVEMDVTLQNRNGRVYAPARYLCEGLGFKVDWDGATRTVLITSAEAAVEDDGKDAGTAAVLGGWTNVSTAAELPADVQTAFEKATADEDTTWTPIAYLGSQVVSGTNYKVLAKDDTGTLSVLTIYADLEGNASITDTKSYLQLVAAIRTDEEDSAEQLAGGWTVNTEELNASLPENVQTAFDSVFAEWVGKSFTPMCLLGSQVANGSNYAILCRTTLATADGYVNGLALLLLNVKTDNTATITDIYTLDLSAM